MADIQYSNLKVWSELIKGKLPISDNITYKVCTDTYYRHSTREHVITCNVEICKTIDSTIRIPVEAINSANISIVDSYVELLGNQLIEQITGEKIERNYIIINGVKYIKEKQEE